MRRGCGPSRAAAYSGFRFFPPGLWGSVQPQGKSLSYGSCSDRSEWLSKSLGRKLAPTREDAGSWGPVQGSRARAQGRGGPGGLRHPVGGRGRRPPAQGQPGGEPGRRSGLRQPLPWAAASELLGCLWEQPHPAGGAPCHSPGPRLCRQGWLRRGRILRLQRVPVDPGPPALPTSGTVLGAPTAQGPEWGEGPWQLRAPTSAEPLRLRTEEGTVGDGRPAHTLSPGAKSSRAPA